MYEMFLGPVEQSKPWDTNGIDGVHRFIKKFWSLFYDRNDNYLVTDEPATKEELKSLHKLIKKVTGDIEQFSYNTSISAFMICVNELFGMKCSKKEILNQFIIVLAPFAPHVCEELWETLGNAGSVCDAKWPVCNEEYLVEIRSTTPFPSTERHGSTWSSRQMRHRMPSRLLYWPTNVLKMDGRQVHRQSNRSAEEDCEHRCQITDMQITNQPKRK